MSRRTPFWNQWNKNQIADFCQELQVDLKLTKLEREYLVQRMIWRSERLTREGLKNHKPVSKTVSLKLERAHKKYRKQAMKTRPIHTICRDAEILVDNSLWRIGCLEIESGRWLWTEHSRREQGEFWYANEISKTIRDLRRSGKRGEIGSVAIKAFA